MICKRNTRQLLVARGKTGLEGTSKRFGIPTHVPYSVGLEGNTRAFPILLPTTLILALQVQHSQLRPRRGHITRGREGEVPVERGGRTLQHRAQLCRLRFFLDAVLDLGAGVVDGRPRVVAVAILSRLPLLLRVRRLYRWAAGAVEACVEIKLLRRVRAESSRRPPRHRRDACSMAWRCRFLTARPSQDGRAIAEK